MKVRVKDIAQKAGVSSASVSNVLNGKCGVSESTSQRILSIARELGYEFRNNNQANRGYVRLVSFKRHGLVVMDTQFFAEMMEALERQCHQAGLKMMVSNINMQKDADYFARVREICQEDCAGILLLATEMYSEDVELFSHTKAPLLVIDSLFRNKRFNCVVMNNQEAGYMATERFIRMGHSRIDHITSSVQLNNMKYRRLGYQSAMEEARLPYTDKSIWRVTPTLEGAYRDMHELLQKHEGELPTAFFAANDIIAAGAVRALKEKGCRLPQQVSIIGMDDLAICQITNPVLSTIHVPREAIARAAVGRLLAMMQEENASCILKTQVGVEFVDRQSVQNIRNL